MESSISTSKLQPGDLYLWMSDRSGIVALVVEHTSKECFIMDDAQKETLMGRIVLYLGNCRPGPFSYVWHQFLAQSGIPCWIAVRRTSDLNSLMQKLCWSESGTLP